MPGRQRRATIALLSFLSTAATAAAQPPSPPQRAVVYFNANIYTADPAHPRASAIAFEGSNIIAVGSDFDVGLIAALHNAKATDLRGQTILPGLIDAHGHMASLGALGLGALDLSQAKSESDLVTAATEAAKKKKPGDWLLGGQWDQESWPGKALPTHTALSRATPDNPIWLRRVDGHAGLANAAAMAAAKITRDTPNPIGGEIAHDSDGNPTGVFIDNAMDLVSRAIPAAARAEPQALLAKAQEMCLAAGLTGVHDAGVNPADIAVYQRLEKEGQLKLRIYVMVSGPYAMRWYQEHDPIIAREDGGRLTVRAAKLYMDGAMGSRGAWLLEPYADRPLGEHGDPYTGLSVSEPSLIEAVAKHALDRGYQVCTHAIGDRGNREVLDAYERAIKSAGPSAPKDHRFRIEHAQLLSPQDIPRFAQLGVIPSMQPTHATSDMRWAEARVGPTRVKGNYAWASLLRTGVRIAGGSDFPVESHNPFLGFYAAITRQNASGEPSGGGGGWMPQERMTREEALRAFTIDAAYASFQEKTLGSLEPGKQADFIIIDRDIMTCEPHAILETKVLQTVVGGQTAYQAQPR